MDESQRATMAFDAAQISIASAATLLVFFGVTVGLLP